MLGKYHKPSVMVLLAHSFNRNTQIPNIYYHFLSSCNPVRVLGLVTVHSWFTLPRERAMSIHHWIRFPRNTSANFVTQHKCMVQHAFLLLLVQRRQRLKCMETRIVLRACRDSSNTCSQVNNFDEDAFRLVVFLRDVKKHIVRQALNCNTDVAIMFSFCCFLWVLLN